jgi:anthranilate synthase/aminodeoxychorismate synthase-like glutamine amidotransferase
MRILLIDNYDSFTYNLVHYLEGENCDVDIVRTNELGKCNYLNYNRILISPGPKLPKDYPELYFFLDSALGKIPILGVCLGLQLIGELLGGKLYNLEKVRHGVSVELTQIENSVLFKGMPKQFNVGLYHSWAIQKTNASNFDVTAIDEKGVVMALEKSALQLYGVQFHPESILTNQGKKILANFIELT